MFAGRKEAQCVFFATLFCANKKDVVFRVCLFEKDKLRGDNDV